ALHLIWAMDVHHQNQLTGGASLNKALSIMANCPVWPDGLSQRTLCSAWSRRKLATPFCAAFALVFKEALLAPSGEVEEWLKIAYTEDLHLTLGRVAAYERFGSTFRPHGNNRPLLDPQKVWSLRGVEANDAFLPPLL